MFDYSQSREMGTGVETAVALQRDTALETAQGKEYPPLVRLC
jgi:hypothetical protein